MAVTSTADDETMAPQEEKDEESENKWKAGDRVFAVWAGNNCYYSAVVNEVQAEKRTLTVLWDDQETTHQLVSFDQVMAQQDESKAWSMKRIEQKAEVRNTNMKGRCLFTREGCDAGTVVFVEEPLLVALPTSAPKIWEYMQKLHEAQPLNLGTVTFHYAALLSQLQLDAASINIIVDKFVPEPDEEPGEDVVRILSGLTDDMHEKLNVKENPLDPRRLQRLVSAWRYNSFGHHKEDGLVLYNRISMCSHSCDPSCCWSYGDDDAFVLRARVALDAGDELTLSYLQDEDLLKSTSVRQQKLQNWRFTCQCDRCSLHVDRGRGFRCRKCRIGIMYATVTGTLEPCHVCRAKPSQEESQTILNLEEDYVNRVEALDKNDVADIEAVFQAALEYFERHWILYVMDTHLWDAYKEKKPDDAIKHQQRRIDFHEHYYARPTFILAWAHEEMGDFVQSLFSHRKWQYVSEWNRAFSMLSILCGTRHQYTGSPYQKIWQVQNNHTEPAQNISAENL